MKSLAIFLHGVGSSGADLEGVKPFLAPHLPDTIFAFPNGPHPFDQGGFGYQWFSIAGVTPDSRPQRILQARPSFDETIGGLIDQAGLTDTPERVALIGFSQGSIMALDALVSGRWPVGAVIAFSGRLASPDPLHPSRSTRAVLIHGTADPVIPAAESQQTQAQLTDLGISSELHLIPGAGHTIAPEGLTIATQHLRALFG